MSAPDYHGTAAEDAAINAHSDALRGPQHDTCEECGVDWCCGEECCEACPNRCDSLPTTTSMADLLRWQDQ